AVEGRGVGGGEGAACVVSRGGVVAEARAMGACAGRGGGLHDEAGRRSSSGRGNGAGGGYVASRGQRRQPRLAAGGRVRAGGGAAGARRHWSSCPAGRQLPRERRAEEAAGLAP